MLPESEIVATGYLYERIKFLKENVARKLISRKAPTSSVNWEFLSDFCRTAYDREWLPVLFFMAQYEGKRIQTKPEMRFLNNRVSMSKYVDFVKKFKHSYEYNTSNIITSLQKTKYLVKLYMLSNEIDSYDEFLEFKTFNNQAYPDIYKIYKLGLLSEFLVALSDKTLYKLMDMRAIDKDNNLDNFRYMIQGDNEALQFYQKNFDNT